VPDINDPNYLRDQQYRDASNLNARIELHRHFGTNPVHWTTWLFDQFRLPLAGRILELGCGPGLLWRANLERLPPGWEITLSDFSPGMLAEARQALGPHASRFYWREIDAQAIPYADGTFAGVIANHMLYHVPDRPKALGEIARVLAPGSIFYASTVGDHHMREIDELLAHAFPDLPLKRPFFQATEGFTLENGAEQLKEHFAAVALRRYKNDLRVTEAGLLVAYIFSGIKAQTLTSRRAELAGFIERELAKHNGVITITGDTGMFHAIKAW
jgi:ubiquinone/menaquinone biosynthesis C-methylase UbiE